jgi:hypothetical protein
MLCYLLDQLFQNLSGSLGQILVFMLELASFAGLFLLIWSICAGLILNSWRYDHFLLAIIILGIIGPGPAWTLITQGFPDFSTLLGVNGLLP